MKTWDWKKQFKSHDAYCKEKSKINYASPKKTYINEGETVIRVDENADPITVGSIIRHRLFGLDYYSIRVTNIRHIVPMHKGAWVCINYEFVNEEDANAANDN